MNENNYKKFIPINNFIDDDSFYLNNKKLIKKLIIRLKNPIEKSFVLILIDIGHLIYFFNINLTIRDFF